MNSILESISVNYLTGIMKVYSQSKSKRWIPCIVHSIDVNEIELKCNYKSYNDIKRNEFWVDKCFNKWCKLFDLSLSYVF